MSQPNLVVPPDWSGATIESDDVYKARIAGQTALILTGADRLVKGVSAWYKKRNSLWGRFNRGVDTAVSKIPDEKWGEIGVNIVNSVPALLNYGINLVGKTAATAGFLVVTIMNPMAGAVVGATLLGARVLAGNQPVEVQETDEEKEKRLARELEEARINYMVDRVVNMRMAEMREPRGRYYEYDAGGAGEDEEFEIPDPRARRPKPKTKKRK